VTVADLAVTESCTRCGLCAFACPWKLLALPEGGAPGYREGVAQRCNLCGHCEAVCPTGALAVTAVRLQPAVGDSPVCDLDPIRLGGYLRMRRSIRSYRDEPVLPDAISQMMDIVRFAPSGRNRQDVQWLVIHDTRELRRLTQIAMEWLSEGSAGTKFAERFDVPGMLRAWGKGQDPLLLHAPHLVLAHVAPGNAVARTNAIIALAHLDVMAPAFQIGTCWAGIFMLAVDCCQRLNSELGLPPGQVPVHSLMLGYPAIRYQRPPKRNAARIIWR
jgi:nitroreductase/NAD-dependent dihydropyrimidine dehydrogenase PreA subunit